MGFIVGWRSFNLGYAGFSRVSVRKCLPDVVIQELIFEAPDDLEKLMALEELEGFFSDKRVKFVVEKGEV